LQGQLHIQGTQIGKYDIFKNVPYLPTIPAFFVRFVCKGIAN
jgi:hypothetical protein